MIRKSFILLTVAAMLTANCTPDEPAPDLAAYAREIAIEEPADTATMLAFLHLSDLHASTASLLPAVYYLNSSPSCDFALVTGDVMATGDVVSTMRAASKPCLLIPGNHDAYTVYVGSVGQYAFRTSVTSAIGQQHHAHFAGSLGNYWYADFRQGSYTLRVVGLDQYELQTVGHPADSWDHMECVYSQEQVDWLIALLERSAGADGLIIAMHNGFGNRHVQPRDPQRTGPFTSILAAADDEGYGYYGTGNTLLVPDIVEAYITGRNISRRYANSSVVGDSLTVTTHFRQRATNFIAYLGGHLHYDVAEPLPLYPRQLQVLITECGESGQSRQLDDAPKNQLGNPAYSFNLCTVDFAHRQLRIKRIGACRKTDGTERHSVVFSY